MLRFVFLSLDTALAALMLIPVFLLLEQFFFHSSRQSFRCYLFSVYLCAVYSVAGLPDIHRLRIHLHIILKPFQYMFSALDLTLLNILLFLPLGALLPIFWRRYRTLHRTVLFGLGLSAFIELTQIFCPRVTDINDLVTNTLGTFLGWCLGTLIRKCFPSILPSSRTVGLYISLAVSFLLMFFLFPLVADPLFRLLLPTLFP